MEDGRYQQKRVDGPLWARRLLWFGVVSLVIVGIIAGVSRLVFLDDLLVIGDSYRARFFELTGLNDPFTAIRPAEMRWFDRRYADHPLLTSVHALLGVGLLVLASLQLSRDVRNRWLEFHRWSGRIVIALALVIVGTSVPFGVAMPFGGPAEVVITILVGGFGLGALTRGLVEVRHGNVERHREWMLRGFAAMVGISMVRVVGAPLDLILTPLEVSPRTLFALSLWVGWGLTLGVTELWIRYTRTSPDSVQVV